MKLTNETLTQSCLCPCVVTHVTGICPSNHTLRHPELTFPFQLGAVGDELQRVCLVWSINVVHVDVQVIRCLQEVVGQDGTFALVQR